MHFEKYSGCGNDFILVDNRTAGLTLSAKEIATLSDRHQGIGADGLIFLQNSSKANFRMRIFNSDGSEAEMCGNGIRCLALFIKSLGYPHSTVTIETMKSTIPVQMQGDLVTVTMPQPTHFIKTLTLHADGRTFEGSHLDTGVPHFVTFVDNLDDDSLIGYAPKLRHAEVLKPRGANINFAQILSHTTPTVAIRTYERGVEAETQACGTGAVAAGLIAAVRYGFTSPVTIVTRSGETLKISFNNNAKDPTKFTDIMMTGIAKKIFSGIFHIPYDQRSLTT